jgi:hypothetical protein
MKIFFLLLLLTATAAHGETYKWIDGAGTVHFSESLGAIPAIYRKTAKPLGITATTAPPATSSSSPITSNENHSLSALKDRMLQDQGAMEQIRALQHDPEMQLLLSSPEVLQAVQSGNYSALINHPAFKRLLDNPRIKEIQKRMQ